MAAISSREIARQIALQCQHAVETGSPLLLLVFYQDEAEKLEVLAGLYRDLGERGISYEQLDPAHRPDQGTGRLYDSIAASSREGVAIVPAMPRREDATGLDPIFLGYFNLHRDRIASDRLRFILFLRENEAEQFIEEAGDLWDFRHHTFWLTRSPRPRGAELWDSLERESADLPLPDIRPQELEKHIASVRALIEATTAPEEKLGLLLDLAQWLQRRKASASAVEVAMEGVALSSEENLDARCRFEHVVGNALLDAARLSEALPHFERSLALARQIGQREWFAANSIGISRIYRTWGRYDEALANLESAIIAARDLGDRRSEAGLLNQVGIVNEQRNCYAEALKSFEQALEIAFESDPVNERRALSNMAVAQSALGDDDGALKSLQRSLAVSKSAGDRVGEGWSLAYLSGLYQRIGNYEAALRSLEGALTIAQGLRNRFLEATVLDDLGNWHLVQDRAEDALPFLLRSLETSRAAGHRKSQARALNHLALAYRSLGRHQDSRRVLELSLSIFRDLGDMIGEAKVARILAREWARRGDLEKALPLAGRAVEIDQSLGRPDLEEDRKFLSDLVERDSGRALRRAAASSRRR